MFPTPDDPGQAPIWENYITAQLTEASLGLIPLNALALGVRVNGDEVTIHCQLRALTKNDTEDLAEIVGELEILVGPNVRVRCVPEVRSEPALSPHDGIRWTFTAPDRLLGS